MSLSETKVDSIDIAALLNGVDSGEVVLPDFQRRFEWSEHDTIAAIATVLTKWPIGSLLLLEGAPGFLRTRPFDGTNDSLETTNSPDAEYVVLDGQQRITSLYHALWDKGKRIFAIDLSQLETDPSPENLEESVKTFNRERWKKKYGTPQTQLAHSLIPLAKLRTPSEFFAWRDKAIKAFDGPKQEAISEHVSRLYRDLFSGVDRYRVPAIIVSKRTPPAAIARIFERVNKTGMKLQTFDLMVAIAYDGSFNLREEWDKARLVSHPIVGEFFGENGMPALHVMSLQRKLSLRDSAVVQLTGHEIRANWPSAIEALAEVARFSRKHLGIQTVAQAPYLNSLLVLAALTEVVTLESRASSLEAWFWWISFSGRYDAASNTRAVSDFRELAADQTEPLSPFPLIEEEALTNTTRQKAAFHRAFAAFLSTRLSQAIPGEPANTSRFRSVLSQELGVGSVRPAELTLGFAWLPDPGASSESLLRSVSLRGQLDPGLAITGSADEFLRERFSLLVAALRGLGLEVHTVSAESDVE